MSNLYKQGCFLLFALLPAAAPAACNPGGTELCCDSVVETNCLSFSRPSWGGVSATNDCDGASFGIFPDSN